MQDNSIYNTAEKQLNCSLNHLKELEYLNANKNEKDEYKALLAIIVEHIEKCRDILKIKEK